MVVETALHLREEQATYYIVAMYREFSPNYYDKIFL